MSEVATIHSEIAPTTPVTPQAMLSMAVARGDIAMAEKLMDLADRWDKRNERKAFDAAIAAAKAELPVIIKNQAMNAGAGRTQYKYEDMAAIARAVDPVLAQHGIYYRFRTSGTATHLTVTCILSHEAGHFEENSLTAPNDTSGSKNAVQAIGSTQTYLQRYTLKAALGLAASADDDASSYRARDPSPSQAVPDDGERLTKAQIAELRNLMEWKKAPEAEFLKWAKVASLEDISPAYFASCKHALQNYKGPAT